MKMPHGWASFKSRLPRIIVSALPLVGSKVINVPFVWPPLGSLETYAAVLATAIIAAIGMVPGMVATKARAKRQFIVMVFVSAVSLICYGSFLATRVVGVETPENGKQYRTVGKVRTDLARQKFDGAPNELILKRAGLTDDAIKRMWTPDSVDNARIELFIWYLLTMGSINYALGAFARASKSPIQK
jgi:hypothetical protein